MNSPVYDPLVVITLAALATYASRGLGTILSGRIHVDGWVVEWITCVTYALMAGLVVRMIILPLGALTHTPEWIRLSATGLGLAAFYLAHKNIAVGVTIGSVALAIFVLLT